MSELPSSQAQESTIRKWFAANYVERQQTCPHCGGATWRWAPWLVSKGFWTEPKRVIPGVLVVCAGCGLSRFHMAAYVPELQALVQPALEQNDDS